MEAKPGVQCSHMSSCELFPHFRTHAFLRIWQINYCEGSYERCARYRLTLEGKQVDATLLPNGDKLTVGRKTS